MRRGISAAGLVLCASFCGGAGAGEVQTSPSETPLGSRLEITAGTNGLFSFSSTSTQISIFAEARYRVLSWLQLGGSAAYRYQSANSTSDSAFQGLVGPTFNIAVQEGEEAIRSAFFISPKLGVTTGQTMFGSVVVNSATQFTMALIAGKRFGLTRDLAYSPSVGVVKELSFDPNFTIQPFSLSAFF